MVILGEAKVGDELIVKYYSTTGIEVVTKTTKLQVQTKNRKFNKDTGRAIGSGGFHISTAELGTPDGLVKVRVEIRQRNLVRILDNLDWKKYSRDDIEAVFELLKEREILDKNGSTLPLDKS